MVWYSFSVRNLLVYAFLKCYAGEIYNHLKVVKTDQRTSLSSSSLNSILRIKLRQIKITNVHDEFAVKTVSHWYNNKFRKLKQKSESHTT